MGKLPSAKKTEPEKPKKATIPGFGVFSDKEAQEMKEILSAKLETHFESLDSYLWERQKLKFGESLEEEIWSNIDEEELDALVSIWVKWGKRNRYVAEAARVTVEATEYVQVGIMLLPRLRKTVKVLKETYIPIRVRGEQKNAA